MNPIVDIHSPVRRQSGAVSVAIVLVIMFILTAAVISMMKVSGSSVIDAANNEEQVTALFLAESGVERALSVVSAAAGAGTMDASTCNNLAGTSYPVGGRGGTFEYESPEAFPSGCGGGTPCLSCAITVKGKLGTSMRTVRLKISTTPSEGVGGCGSTVIMPLPVLSANSYAFTHLAYRAKDDGSGCSAGTDPSNARVASCEITSGGGTCDVTATGDFWDLGTTGTNAVSSMGVASSAPNIGGTFIITTKLEVGGTGQARGTGTPVKRNYVQTGVLFRPLPPASGVSEVGTYSSNSTFSATGLGGSISSDWTCQKFGATTSGQMSLAANADTLVYGFASWPADPSQTLSAVTVGIQPLHRLTTLTGLETDHIYSQIWYSYNRAYDSKATSGTIPSANNGSTFTGAVGAVVTGKIDNGLSGGSLGPGNTLTVTNISGGGNYGEILPAAANGDTIPSAGGVSITAQVTPLTGGESLGGKGRYTVSGSAQQIPSGTLSISSAKLRITNLTGVVTVLDTIGGFPGGSPAPFTAATNGNYALTGQNAPFAPTANMTSSPPAITAIKSQPAYIINLTGSPTQTPTVGTAVANWSGTGGFASTPPFSGKITGGNLITTTNVALCYGDALFGAGFKEPLPSTNDLGIKPNTTIARPGCNTGNSFAVNGADTDAIDRIIVARPAVIAKNFTGDLSGTTLQVTAVISGSVSVGDTLIGTGIPPGTKITGFTSGTAGGPGTYTLDNTSAGTNINIVATNPNSFAVSRSPGTLRNGAICGGVCAMFFNTTGSIDTNFTLAGITNGDDWSSGFACLSGLDPDNVQTLGKKVAKRGSWAEIVR